MSTPRRAGARAAPQTAVAGVERMKLYALGLSRLGGLLNVGAALVSGVVVGVGSAGPQPLTYALLAAIGVESAALFAVSWRRGRLSVPLVAADTVYSALGVIANGLITRQPAHTWLGLYMYPYTMVAGVIIGVAFRRLAAMFAATTTIICAYLVASVSISHSTIANDIPNAVSYLATIPIVWAVARGVERSAAAQDASKAEAELRSAELAREKERSRHARLLHDRILQTMTMLSRADWILDEELRRHVAADAAWLRALIEGKPADTPDDLVNALHDVRVTKTGEGLHIMLNTAGLGEPGNPDRALPRPVIEAMCGAVFEALTNVRKHSGVRTAFVRAAVEGDRIVVSVADQGVGFDSGATHGGFGLANSVRARISEVGGQVDIDSAPDAGTVVLVTVPAMRQ